MASQHPPVTAPMPEVSDPTEDQPPPVPPKDDPRAPKDESVPTQDDFAPPLSTGAGSRSPSPAPLSDSVIEAADGPIDSDEFESEDWESETGSNASVSVTSSIYAHAYKDGRRFHKYKYGRYPIPNDDLEQNREGMKHAMMMELADGNLFFSPIGDSPQKILDLGTGTGIWAIEVADQFPSAEVLGVDLSPIQPPWVPPNVKFVIDDCEDTWENGSGWDMIHLRHMSIILKNVPKVCEEAFANLKPGGWMEWQEFHAVVRCDDGSMAEDDTLAEFYRISADAFKRLGFNTTQADLIGDYLYQAGFENIQCVVKKVPIGPWARGGTHRLIGRYQQLAIHDIIPVLTGKPLELLGYNQTEREVWKAKVTQSLYNSDAHRYWNSYFWYAQKPV